MPWKVRSSMNGSTRLSVAQQSAYQTHIRRLESLATRFSSLSASWMSLSLQKRNNAQTIGGINHQYSPLLYQQEQVLASHCSAQAVTCKHIYERLDELAHLLARANNLYADSELHAQQGFDNIASTVLSLFPVLSVPMLASAGIAAVLDAADHTGLMHISRWSHATYPLHAAMCQGLARSLLNPITGLPFAFINRSKYSPIAALSKGLTMFSKPVTDFKQGNRLRLESLNLSQHDRRVLMPHHGTDMGHALQNLTALSDLDAPKYTQLNPDAHAIAIQRIRRPDGSRSWLISIPGTDGRKHSPFGWMQNLEVMSDSAVQRKRADSTRMVIEAMRQSGIKPHEPVVLVGHSQGGIVAASIASDYTKEYNITHIVTAGAPIANHPIAKRTWVTSIEMDDEIVSSLDGARNPARTTWATIRAHAWHEDKQRKKSRNAQDQRYNNLLGATVKHVDESGTLTHDMHFHCAAYENASKLDSEAIRLHETHFQEFTRGKVEATTIWQGRMYQ